MTLDERQQAVRRIRAKRDFRGHAMVYVAVNLLLVVVWAMTGAFYPAIDLVKSSTRRDDLLHEDKVRQRVWVLRKYLADMNPIEAMEFVNDKIKFTNNNEEFLMSMNG